MSLLCDITKAFDKMHHQGLIYNIKAGILQWVENYLHGCSQHVIQGKASVWGSIEAGVPQGSVWALLYSLFMLMILQI